MAPVSYPVLNHDDPDYVALAVAATSLANSALLML